MSAKDSTHNRSLGILLFWLLWPVQWLWLPLTRRVRVVIVRGETVLLVKNWIGAGEWELPGGGIHRGESVNDAARREIKEELNYTLNGVIRLDDEPLVVRRRGLSTRLHFVIAHDMDDSAATEPNWELSETRWAPLSEVEDIVPKHLYKKICEKTTQ